MSATIIEATPTHSQRIRDLIQRALDHTGTHSLADVEDAIAQGTAQLWVDGDSVVVTAIEHTPLKTVLHYLIASGELPTLEKMSPAIEEWAKAQGCSGAVLIGRKGWARTFLTHQGWKETHVVMTKDLACQA